MHTRDELEKLDSNNLEWFRGKFCGLQGTYADERTGEIVLDDLHARGSRGQCRSCAREADSRLGAPLRIEMTTAKVGPAILDRAP